MKGLPRIGTGCQGPRFHRCRWIASALFWSIAFNCIPSQSHAAGLDCPELGIIAIPNLFADLVATGNSVDLANEINDAVNKLQIAQPNISYAELTNVAIAAYCRVVANTEGLAPCGRVCGSSMRFCNVSLRPTWSPRRP